MSWWVEFVEKLTAAPPHVNPAIALAAEALAAEARGDTEFLARDARGGEVERCVRAGEAEGAAVSRALGTLARAIPAASQTAPEGFGA